MGTANWKTLNITWAKTIQSTKKGDLIAIVNQDKSKIQKIKDYLSISPKSIHFELQSRIKDHRKWIPSEFNLTISESKSDDTNQCNATVHMKSSCIQHTRIFTIHYWRYHVITNGKIRYGSTNEILNNKPQIIEFLSFK